VKRAGQADEGPSTGQQLQPGQELRLACSWAPGRSPGGASCLRPPPPGLARADLVAAAAAGLGGTTAAARPKVVAACTFSIACRGDLRWRLAAAGPAVVGCRHRGAGAGRQSARRHWGGSGVACAAGRGIRGGPSGTAPMWPAPELLHYVTSASPRAPCPYATPEPTLGGVDAFSTGTAVAGRALVSGGDCKCTASPSRGALPCSGESAG
jgi:hypothetical protein